jgi:predicted anti-sigma-YlaC factor YlaD
MDDTWRDRLSEYLDGELSVEECRACERHLEACPDCAAVLTDLRDVVARAQRLEDRPPVRDLWAEVADRLRAPAPARRRRRIAFSVPQLLAASLALVVVSAGTAWLATSVGRDARPSGAVVPAAEQPVAVFAALPGFDAAVADLERVLEERRNQLDPATVRVLDENLAVIDQAIAEAYAALVGDPASQYLSQHLAETMWRKVRLLRRAAEFAVAAT